MRVALYQSIALFVALAGSNTLANAEKNLDENSMDGVLKGVKGGFSTLNEGERSHVNQVSTVAHHHLRQSNSRVLKYPNDRPLADVDSGVHKSVSASDGLAPRGHADGFKDGIAHINDALVNAHHPDRAGQVENDPVDSSRRKLQTRGVNLSGPSTVSRYGAPATFTVRVWNVCPPSGMFGFRWEAREDDLVLDDILDEGVEKKDCTPGDQTAIDFQFDLSCEDFVLIGDNDYSLDNPHELFVRVGAFDSNKIQVRCSGGSWLAASNVALKGTDYVWNRGRVCAGCYYPDGSYAAAVRDSCPPEGVFSFSWEALEDEVRGVLSGGDRILDEGIGSKNCVAGNPVVALFEFQLWCEENVLFGRIGFSGESNSAPGTALYDVFVSVDGIGRTERLSVGCESIGPEPTSPPIDRDHGTADSIDLLGPASIYNWYFPPWDPYSPRAVQDSGTFWGGIGGICSSEGVFSVSWEAREEDIILDKGTLSKNCAAGNPVVEIFKFSLTCTLCELEGRVGSSPRESCNHKVFTTVGEILSSVEVNVKCTYPPVPSPAPTMLSTTNLPTSITSHEPMTVAPAPPPSPTSRECIDFATAADGTTSMTHADYVKYEWFSEYDLTISATASDGGYTPDGKVRIYDTALGDDPGLGSPNKKCATAGPGVGAGGEPGSPGVNCEPQGKVLIIQQADKIEPTSAYLGGRVSLSFELPVRLISIGLMNVGTETTASVEIYPRYYSPYNIAITGLGDNSIQDVVIDPVLITIAVLNVTGPFAIRDLCFGRFDSEPSHTPVPSDLFTPSSAVPSTSPADQSPPPALDPSRAPSTVLPTIGPTIEVQQPTLKPTFATMSTPAPSLEPTHPTPKPVAGSQAPQSPQLEPVLFPPDQEDPFGVKDDVASEPTGAPASAPPPNGSPGPAKKKFTWSIKKNWTEDGTYTKGNGNGQRLFPPKGTEIGYILPPDPRIGTVYPFEVDEGDFVTHCRLAFASWQSVIDVQFEQVPFGGDIVLEVVANINVLTNGYITTGAGGWGPPGRIVLGLYRRTLNFSQENYLNWGDANSAYFVVLHELGHVLGLWHTFEDSAAYSPMPLGNTAAMDYKFVMPDGTIKQYLNDVDISRAQRIWGPSKYEPVIQLWIPSWQKSFYTTSWNEANSLVKHGFASDVQWFYGVLSKTEQSYHSPLYRNYNGKGRHTYTVDAPEIGSVNEGVMGYLWRPNYKNLTPLYKHYSEAVGNYLLSDKPEIPGYTLNETLGYIISTDAMVGFAEEKSNF